MADIKGEYRFSALGVILWGVALIVVGSAFYEFAAGTGINGLGWILALSGLIVLIIGIVRAVRERDARQTLSDKAARTVIAGNASPRDNVSTELQRLTDLHTAGSLSDDEFAAAKAKVLERG
jgi:hypothetical protein